MLAVRVIWQKYFFMWKKDSSGWASVLHSLKNRIISIWQTFVRYFDHRSTIFSELLEGVRKSSVRAFVISIKSDTILKIRARMELWCVQGWLSLIKGVVKYEKIASRVLKPEPNEKATLIAWYCRWAWVGPKSSRVYYASRLDFRYFIPVRSQET